MVDNDRQLNDEQRTALKKFIVESDRGRAAIFVGRKSELALIRNRLDLLVQRQDEQIPGADLTTVVQGAPGAGKSALLMRVRDEWTLGVQGQPMAISLDPGVLKLPTPNFLKIVASKVERVPRVVRILRKLIGSMSVGAADATGIQLGMKSYVSSRQISVPIILLFDEIQTELMHRTSDQSWEHLNSNLRLLHTGEHRAPIFPIYGGLANSADLLHAAGLTRLASGSELTLSRFSDEETEELLMRFVEQYLSSARPRQPTIDQCRVALIRDSQGWPMHCRNFLIALAVEIKTKNWHPDAIDLDAVRTSARQLRFSYYLRRMRGILEDRYMFVSTVLEAMRGTDPKARIELVDLIAKAKWSDLSESLDSGTLPEGVTAEQAFDAMLHAGIVQKTDSGRFTCPIPSLADYVAAKSTIPPNSLHEAVLAAGTEEIDRAMERCRNNKERGDLLRATDIRGRTPLILAAELGMVSLVEYLLEVDRRLPVALQTVEFRDKTDRTARDHAVESGEERIIALLDQVQFGKSS